MNNNQYKDTGKLTDVNYGSAKSNQTSKSQSISQQGQAITHEQVSDTLTEGTIDYKLEQQKSK